MAETLQGLAGLMTVPGLPAWTGFVLLVAVGVSVLAFLAMPFSVFGVKSRLEAIEGELADLRAEIRALARLPAATAAPSRSAVVEEDWAAPPARAARTVEEPRLSPPVPPPAARVERPARPARAEPRLDWPKADRGA
ncbi:hypothetical protein [Roseomonas sp. HF4]|uniref:hypothetical protein n=1 Tax=Roseomonas sp. HF4 TaxID=2562313 RepID=UPI0010C07551|nr:hypothetical protein [Roseomonas sp. HF4]